MKLADHCGHCLAQIAKNDHRIWVLDGDLADSDGAIHFASAFPERFIMAGIAEQSMISVAAGMASCGLRPWVFSFAAFLMYRAFDQIRICINQCDQPVTMVGSHSGGLNFRNGKTHTAVNDLALILSLRNIEVWSPMDPDEVVYSCHQIIERGKPAYLRLPRRPLESIVKGIPAGLRVINEPSEITIISTGMATHLGVEVCHNLERAMGKRVGLVHCLQLSPFPDGEIRRLLANTKVTISIEDHSVFGGLASIIGGLELYTKKLAYGWPANWQGQSGTDESLLELKCLLPHQITNDVIAAL